MPLLRLGSTWSRPETVSPWALSTSSTVSPMTRICWLLPSTVRVTSEVSTWYPTVVPTTAVRATEATPANRVLLLLICAKEKRTVLPRRALRASGVRHGHARGIPTGTPLGEGARRDDIDLVNLNQSGVGAGRNHVPIPANSFLGNRVRRPDATPVR